MTVADSLETQDSGTHFSVHSKHYLFFLVIAGIVFFCCNYWEFKSVPTAQTSLSDILQVMLGLSGFTIPLLVSYLMHPHVGLYEFLSRHLSNRLGAVSLYSNDIRSISASVSQPSSEPPETVRHCLWILEHEMHEASGNDLSTAGKKWLLDNNGNKHHGSFRQGNDRQMTAFLVVTLAICMVASFAALSLDMLSVNKWVTVGGQTAAIVSFFTNVAAYYYLMNVVTNRQKLKATGIRTINTNFNDVVREMKKLKGDIKEKAEAAQRAAISAEQQVRSRPAYPIARFVGPEIPGKKPG